MWCPQSLRRKWRSTHWQHNSSHRPQKFLWEIRVEEHAENFPQAVRKQYEKDPLRGDCQPSAKITGNGHLFVPIVLWMEHPRKWGLESWKPVHTPGGGVCGGTTPEREKHHLGTQWVCTLRSWTCFSVQGAQRSHACNVLSSTHNHTKMETQSDTSTTKFSMLFGNELELDWSARVSVKNTGEKSKLHRDT